MPPGSLSIESWGSAGDATSTKHRFHKGDILFGKLRPYFKKIVVADFEGICSSDILVLRPREPRWFGLVLGLLVQDRFIAFTERVASGTKMPRIKWKTMADYEIAVPEDTEHVEGFSELMRTLADRINIAIRQSRTLAALRDTLLPKLISGEIRVPEAAELAEDAGASLP